MREPRVSAPCSTSNEVPTKCRKPRQTSALRLYIDSTDRATWEHFLPTGLFYGVTTNPKLLHQAGIPCTAQNLTKLAQAAFELGAQEIHLQVWGGETAPMLAVGRELAVIDPRVSVKVPITQAGILVARQLIEEGVKVTLTAVHAAVQMLPVIALGAAYAAPYMGRMSDAGLDGPGEVIAMQQMITRLESPTRLLVASIRRLSDLANLARNGVETFTLLPPLLEEMINNPLTIKAANDFEQKALGE
jgi:transaldolase